MNGPATTLVCGDRFAGEDAQTMATMTGNARPRIADQRDSDSEDNGTAARDEVAHDGDVTLCVDRSLLGRAGTRKPARRGTPLRPGT